MRTEYFSIIAHDDLIQKEYIKRLLEEISQFPGGASAYSDIYCFGPEEGRHGEEPLTGNKLDRTLRFLSSHFPAISFHGVVRRSIAGEQLLLRGSGSDSFGADTIWNLELALRGTLHRVAEPLYIKRIHESSEHHRWKSWARPKALSAWLEHCRQCTQLILLEGFSAADQSLLLCACISRTLQMTRTLRAQWPYPRIGGAGTVEDVAALGLWMARVLGVASTPREDPFSTLARKEARPLLAEIWARVAEDEAASERLTEAEGAGRESVRLDPTVATFHGLLSSILARRGDLEEALEVGRQSIDLSPENPHLLRHQDGLLKCLDRPEEARRYALEANQSEGIGAGYQRQLCTAPPQEDSISCKA